MEFAPSVCRRDSRALTGHCDGCGSEEAVEIREKMTSVRGGLTRLEGVEE
jgi:hypothetical protein